jgi:hypothetical protein
VKPFLLLAAILLSACNTLPPAPADPCTLLSSCGEAKTAGISATKTVQLMLNSPMLIGGKPAEAAEWPASVYAKAGGSACSATLVGDRTLLMAAHCMGDGKAVTFSAHANQYKATCTHHPDYRGNDRADWALCLVDRPVTGIPFEVLATKAVLSQNQSLLLSGYGCVNPGGGGGNDGIFRIGYAQVKGLPAGSNHFIVTKGGAALCFGDSGGSAYSVQAAGDRYVVGVNSQGDIETYSYLSAVFSTSFVKWAETWAKNSHGVRICGLHADAAGCRTSSPAAPVDGKFEIAGARACLKGVVKSEFLNKKQEIVDGLKELVEKL